MAKLKVLILILALTLLTSCEFIKDTFSYKDKTKTFVEALMEKDYDKCISQMAIESDSGESIDVENLMVGLEQFRSAIEQNFGNEFEYSLIKSEKKHSTIASQSTPPNTTLAFVEFSNKKELGLFQVLFDDKTKKILDITMLDVRYPIPNMLLFWLFGLLPLVVLIFNIYIIRQIKKSSLKRKWLKYITVIILNVPAISYAAVNGLSFKLLSFQIFLGLGFRFMGYIGSVWTFGIPLGGFYCLWRLRKHKYDKAINVQNETPYEEQNIEDKIDIQ